MTAKSLAFVWLLLRLVIVVPIGQSEGLEELVFDLTTLNKDDYVIKWADGEEKSYEFTPKPGRIIDEVKFRGLYAWKRHADFQVESVIVHYLHFADVKYALNVVDGKKSKQTLHFNTMGETYWKLGIIEYNHVIHSYMFHAAKAYYRFDLTSNFDKSFYLRVRRRENGFEVFEFTSSYSFSFDDVADGEELVYSNSQDKVDDILFATKNNERFLLKLSTKSLRKHYFIFAAGKWNVLNDREYRKIYDQHGLLFLSIDFNASVNTGVVDLSLTNVRFLNKYEHHFITVPAIKYSLDVLRELREGPDVILLGELEDAEVIVYRGSYSNDMIEITHNLGARYTAKFFHNLTGRIEGKNTLRGLNSYFIKNDGEWVNVDQVTFFRRFKILLILNLQRANETAKPKDVEKNLVLIEKLKELDAFDTTKRYLTDEFSFTEKPNLLETPDPDPIYYSKPAPIHHPKPAPMPTRPFHKPTPSDSGQTNDPSTPEPNSPSDPQGSEADEPIGDDPYKTPYAEEAMFSVKVELDKNEKANLKKKIGVTKKKSGFYMCSGLFIFAYLLI